MSTLSKTQLKNTIKKYIQDFIHDFELEQATGGRSLRTGMSGWKGVILTRFITCRGLKTRLQRRGWAKRLF